MEARMMGNLKCTNGDAALLQVSSIPTVEKLFMEFHEQ